ncbi:hypothetical protein ABPG75_007792 [Micractinium tetrahymenae]
MAASLETIYSLLKADKVTQRKEGLKLLLNTLVSDATAAALDAATAALPPDGAVPAASWPGLAHVLAKAASDEVKGMAGKKKGPDPQLHRAFRAMVTRAEESERRCGHRHMLRRRAGSLFRHIAEVLDAVGLSSAMGADYAAALRTHLLAVPEYCACSSAHTFQALLNVHMDAIETFGKKPADRQEREAEEAVRALGTMSALLAAFPGDMEPLFQDDCINFFRTLADGLEQMGESAPSAAHRLAPPLLTAVNTFLLANGRDVAASLPPLHAALHGLVLRGAARDPRLRDPAVTYLRIQLQLGTLQRDVGQLQDVQDWLWREMEHPGFKWGESSREGRLLLPKAQAALLDLAAAVYFHSACGAAAELADGAAMDEDAFEAPLPASKGRGVSALLAQLAEHTVAAPSLWAPLLARLLLGYGLALPPAAYAEWLRGLAEAAPRHCPEHFMADEHDADVALWVLRLAHALALAWPLHLSGGRSGGPGSSSAQDAELPPPEAVAEQWMAVWHAVLGYAKSANVPPAGLAAALPVLATIARRRLVQLPPGFHKLWGLALRGSAPTQGAVGFAAAAIRSGQDSAVVDAASWQPETLEWLRSAPPALPPSCMVDVVAAILKLPEDEQPAASSSAGGGGPQGGGAGSGSGSGDDAPSLGVLAAREEGRWWQWWQEDVLLSAQLASLVRGELLMRSRAVLLLAQKAAAAETARAAHTLQLQPGAALAPPPAQEAAAEMLAERLEDVFRQPPSPMVAGTLHVQQNSRLVQLLSTAAAAIQVSTRATRALRAAGRAVPPAWQPAGGLAGKLQLALQQCGGLLAESCKRLEGLFPAEQQRLQAAVEALHCYQRTCGSHELAASLLSCVPAVQDLFLTASTRIFSEVVRATQAAAATRGLAAASHEEAQLLFDDDLDVGGRAPATARAGSTAATARGGRAVSSSASLAAACKGRCADLLCLLGPLHPSNGSKAAQHWLLRAQEPGQAPLTDEARLTLVDTQVQCAVRALAADPAAGTRLGLAAAGALSAEPPGVLSWLPRHHAGRCLFAMRRVQQLAAVAAAAGGAGAGAMAVVQPLLGRLVEVTDDCLMNISDAETKGAESGGAGSKLTSWRLRVAMAEAFVLLFRTDPRLLAGELLEAFQDFLQGLLKDESYGARLAATRLVQALFDKYSQPLNILEGLLPMLNLQSTQVTATENRQQFIETSIFMLGESAASCDEVELRCLCLLCGHVAAAPADLALAGAMLDWLAVRMGYPDRHTYAAWHQRGLLYHFFSGGWGLPALLQVQRLVAPTAEAAAGDARAFLAACAPALTGTLVLGQKEEDLRIVAQVLGTEPQELIRSHFEVLMGLVFPLNVTGRAEDRQFVVEKLARGTIAAFLTTEEVSNLIGSRFVECVGQLLLSARGGGEGAPEPLAPWFSPGQIVEAVNSLYRSSSSGQTPLAERLSADYLARILLVLHCNLELARHPRHAAAALGPLHAALAMLGDRVCEPATFRYVTSILLRLLPVRQVQGQVCELLSGTVARMLRCPAGADLAPVGTVLPALLSRLAEGIEAEHSAGRPLDSPGAKGLLALVAQLTTGAPQELRPHLRQVDPLPDGIPALEQPAALVAAARQDISPAEQLAQFAERAASMAPGLRRRSLAALCRVLTAQQAALFMPAPASGDGRSRDGGNGTAMACLPEVASSAWRLAVLSSELGDAELAEFSGELLALAGPLDPSAIAFDPASAFSPAQLGGSGSDDLPGSAAGGTWASGGGRTQGSQQTPGAAGGGRGGSSRHSRASPAGGRTAGGSSGGTWAAALHLLGDYLVDESVDVIRAAQFTVRRLLTTPEGQAALQFTGPALQPYLQAFQHGASQADGFAQPVGDASSAGSTGAARLDSRKLWRCDRPYAAWVCELADAMLSKASRPTLASCHHMGKLKPAFAELLLPHAFADLAVQPGSGALALELGAVMRRELLPRLHRHPKAARLLLGCLNHLRSQYLEAKLAGGAGCGGAGGGGGGRSKSRAGSGGGANSEVELWRKVYWVELGYLELAQAAARCGAHFTALLYAEAWQEARHGWLVPLAASSGGSGAGDGATGGGSSGGDEAAGGVGSTGGGGGSTAALERLLLDIYSSINEPDGIYAVARSHSMLSQLKRFEHEGDWSRALLTYDLVLQHLGLAGGIGSSGGATQHMQHTQQAQRPSSALGSPGSQAAAEADFDPGTAAAGRQAGGSYEGISRQAAIAGLLRSLSQLGAGHLVSAYAQSADVADGPAAAAALSLGQWGQLGCGPVSSGSGGCAGAAPSGGAGQGFSADAALSAALAGLQAGSLERCRGAVSSAQRGLVAHLVTASLEGAANVNPALVQLQMLQAVSEAWELMWPTLPDLGSIGSPKKRRKQQQGRPGSEAASAAAAAVASAAGAAAAGLQDGVLALWRGRAAAAGAGGRYDLQAPLQGMHQQLLHCLGAADREAELLVAGAVSARKTDHFAQATTSLYKLRSLLLAQQAAAADGGSEAPAWVQRMAGGDASWRVEEAKLLWAQGQQDTAVALARSLLGARPQQQGGGSGSAAAAAMQHAYLRSLTAKWLACTRSDSPSTVLSLMQEAADQTLTAGQSTAAEQRATSCRVLYRLAHYADGLYRNIEAQKASPEYKTAKAVIEAKRRQIAQWTETLEGRKRRGEVKVDRKTGQIVDRESRQLALMIASTRRPVEMDEAEQRLLDERERQFLRTALANYSRCLQTGDGYDLRVVFRVVQLWLRLGADAEVNELVGEAFRSVPSFKFLPLVYQVASRMSAARSGPLVESGFQANLTALLVRLGSEHPHHTLYQVFSLKNGNRGKDGKVASARANEAFSYAVDLDKVAAAEDVLRRVAAASPACRAVVREMGELIDGYIELAAAPAPSKDAEEMAFPGALRRSRQNYIHLPVTSVTLPVDPSGHYEGFPHFVSFAERIKFVGGINKPKIVTVTDSWGTSHRQLVKSGNDDLRQDAVMQQFFWLVNQFLREQPRTQRRTLSIRTYKVVPFSPSSGLLEWVEHTQPMADYLLGPSRTSGAHMRYKRRGDYTWMQCYTDLYKVAQSQPSPEQLRAGYDAVCARFPPAMHHFFLENFRDPGTWFERRLAYMRSMAVNSMAGHIIGLGDRHLQNVLLDTRTADAVHIDLGIAFEQGRFLNTPELVPFRLTRDVVDGMGVAGVEGVMRRCCEETLRVLRASKESILTVVEVFIHDPLYKWALTTTAANRRQHEADAAAAGGGVEDDDRGSGAGATGAGGSGVSVANADAERTLLRIKQKLEGTEYGEGEARGVEGQVQQLLADAQDPDKLSRMYIGWQAWC